MPERKPFDLDQDVTLSGHRTPTTIRREHDRGKLRLNKFPAGCSAEILKGDGTGDERFPILDTDFNARDGPG